MTNTNIPSANFVAEQLPVPGTGETIVTLLKAVAAVCRADKTYATDALFSRVLWHGGELSNGTMQTYEDEFGFLEQAENEKTSEHQAAGLEALGVLVSQNRKYAEQTAAKINARFDAYLIQAFKGAGLQTERVCAYSVRTIANLAPLSKYVTNDDSILLVARQCMRPYNDGIDPDHAVDPEALNCLNALLARRFLEPHNKRFVAELTNRLEERILSRLNGNKKFVAAGIVGLGALTPYQKPSEPLFKRFTEKMNSVEDRHVWVPFDTLEAVLTRHPGLATLERSEAFGQLVGRILEQDHGRVKKLPSQERIEALQNIFVKEHPDAKYSMGSPEANRAAAGERLLAHARKVCGAGASRKFPGLDIS
jgi:hypothetical protein